MNKWYFPLSSHGQIKGLKDSGIETFKGERLSSLSREIIQNSLDAKKDDEKAVRVELKYFYINKESFPDREGFENNLKESLLEIKELKDKTSRIFFEKALEAIKQEKIPFVRISDFSTKGLTGSDQRKSSNWNNLVRSSGISDKGDEAGGSFGIGKNATFTCSEFHTVFYSTLDIENKQACEGVCNLISVYNKNASDYTQGIGYYASDSKNNPIKKQANFDLSFTRETHGTDIYIAGFKFSEEDFEKEILKEVLNNFLYAIYKGTLVVEINNKIIEKSSLGKNINLNRSLLKKETYELYDLLEDEKTIWHTDFNTDDAEEALLGLCIDPEGSRRISAIRKPWMKITYYDGFSRTVDFKGTFIAQGGKMNAILRKMENPQHNKWELDRLEGIERRLGNKLLSAIKKYINDKILLLNSFKNIEFLELEGAEEYIKLIDDETSKKQEKIKDKVLDVKVKSNPVSKTTQSIQTIGEFEAYIDDSGGDEAFDSSTNLGGGSGEIPAEGEIPEAKTGHKVSITRNQIKLARSSKDNTYKLFYKSSKDRSTVSMHVFPLDEEGKKINNVLNILEAKSQGKSLEISGNLIKNIVMEKSVLNIKFKTNISKSLSLGVDIYEIDR